MIAMIADAANRLRNFGPRWTADFLDRFWGPAEARDRIASRFHVVGTQQQRERDGLANVRRFGERGQISPGAVGFLNANPALASVPGFSLIPENVLGMPAFSDYVVGRQGIGEVLRWPLFHIIDYTTGGNTVYRFFNQDQGAATYGANGTNMLQANSLPASEFQIVDRVEYMLMQAQADIDVASATAVVAPGQLQRALYSPSHIEIFIGKKQYLNVGPMGLFPTGTGINSPGFGGGAGAALSTLPYNTGDKWKMIPPIGIAPLWIIQFSGNWSSARAVTTLSFQVSILDGYQVRAVS